MPKRLTYAITIILLFWVPLQGLTWFKGLLVCRKCSFTWNASAFYTNKSLKKQGAGLLGGEVYAPCSLWHFTPFSLLPSIFRCLLPFTNFHGSFFISLCSLLLFNFSSCSLIISLAPCSISQFFAAPCSLFQNLVLPAPRLCFPCSLLTFLF